MALHKQPAVSPGPNEAVAAGTALLARSLVSAHRTVAVEARGADVRDAEGVCRLGGLRPGLLCKVSAAGRMPCHLLLPLLARWREHAQQFGVLAAAALPSYLRLVA